MVYLLSLIIPFFSFFLQSYPRFFNKYFGVDVWTRLIEADLMRKAGHKVPKSIKKGFIIKGSFDYPPLFPFILSFIPKKTLIKIQGYIAPFFDSINNILVFVICYYLTHNIYTSLTSQLIYTFTPLLAVENSNLTPRSFGYTIFTLAFFPVFLYQVNYELIFLIIGLIFTVLLFLSHRFSVQVLLFISIFFTFIDNSLVYLLNILIGFFFATILTKGYYLRVAKGHLFNIYFWVLNYKYRFAHQVYGLKSEKKLDWVGRIYRLLAMLPPFFLSFVDFWSLSGFVYLYLVYTNIIGRNEIFFKMSLWIVFLYITSSLVLKIKLLIPIGEGQRYLEFATVPSGILSSVLFFFFYAKFGTISLLVFCLVLAINLSLILYVQIKGIIMDKNRTLTEDIKKVFSYINKLPGTPRIMCIPHQITTMVVYHTKAEILVNADNPGLIKIMDFYPILKKPISKLAKEYNLDYLLINESYAYLNELRLGAKKIVYRSGNIVLLAIK